MNAEEQRLIEDLFANFRSVSGQTKDREAEDFIREMIGRFPDAPYYLVQSVLVQQQALDRADTRIRDLEDALRRAQSPERASGSSFLGGASVPVTGSRSAAPPTVPPVGQAPVGPWASPQPSGQSGGFLSSALSTATGVAGGMFLADSIRSLFGRSGEVFGTETSGSYQAALDRAQDEAQDARDDAEKARADLAADDAALDEMQDEQDASGDEGWSDDGVDA